MIHSFLTVILNINSLNYLSIKKNARNIHSYHFISQMLV